jgi:hypothetical protein
MKITPLLNEHLLTKTQTLVQEERRITLELIECLEIISGRMLFAELGYGSLFEFCTRHLGLSEGSAHRRISAMRLARDVPQAKEKLKTGELSLTNAAKIQVASQRVLKRSLPGDRQQSKSALVDSCLGLSQNECESKLLAELPGLRESPQHTERKRQVDEALTELKLIVSSEFYQKLERLLNLAAHTNPTKSILQLFEKLVDQELVNLERKRGLKVETVLKPGGAESSNTQTQYRPTNPAVAKQRVAPSEASRPRSRAIPAQTRKLVWSRANGKCQYPGCSSTYLLEVEHQIPFAKGGTHEPDNLMLYCRMHNVLALKREFGIVAQTRTE